MPRYASAGVNVRLSVIDLVSSTTNSLAPAIGKDHAKNLKSISQELHRREEETVLKEVDGGLHFLGAGNDMPFILAATMKDLAAKTNAKPANTYVLHASGSGSTSAIPSTSTSILPATDGPRALYMSVHLSDRSFLPDDYARAALFPLPNFLDAKIDVYYNGELSESTFLPRSRRPKGAFIDLVQHFAGRRVDRLVEQPWVVSGKGSKPVQGSAAKRWDDVAALLKTEAQQLPTGQRGELSILGQYLTSLAGTAMPHQVNSLQKPGEANIGIIDVVLTSGCGKKNVGGAFPALTKPKSLKLIFPPSHYPATLTTAVPASTFNIGHTASTFSAAPAPVPAPVPVRASARVRAPARAPPPAPAPAPAPRRSRYRPLRLTAAERALPRLPPRLFYLSQENGDVKYRAYLDRRNVDSRHAREKRAGKKAAEGQTAAEQVGAAEQVCVPGPPQKDIHADCKCTFEPGVYRQVDWDRGGSFEEKALLVGMRFLVG